MGTASFRVLRWVALAGTGLLAMSALAEEEVPYSRDGADSCLACHEDADTLALFYGKHAVPTDERGPFGHGQLQCEACHGPGGDHAGRVRRGEERPPPVVSFDAPTSAGDVAAQNGQCLNCHQEDAGIAWHAGAHESGEVPCAGCHRSHAASDPVLEAVTQADICFDCHLLQRTETRKAYAHPFFEGQMECTGCHGVHGDALDSSLARQSVNDTCFGCHAEKRGPFVWEHEPVAEDCTLCHSPHGSNHPGMLVRRAPLLCQGCHSQAGHPSIAHDASGLAGPTPSQFLLGQGCTNCHEQVHGSNHPSGSKLMR